MDRVGEGVDDAAVRSGRVEQLEVLTHGPAGDRHALTVEQTRVEQMLQNHGNTADGVEIGHVELAARLHVGDVRDVRPDAVEVGERKVDAGLVGDGEQMEHGVRRATERKGDHDGVLEGFFGQDVASPNVLLEQVHDGLARRNRIVIAAAVDGRRACTPRQRKPQRLADAGHGVRREHAGAAPLGGTRVVLDEREFFVGELADGMGADRFEDTRDVERLAVRPATGKDRAAIEEDRWEIEPRRGHHHARQALVAAGESYQSVEALRVHDRLDRVGNDLPRHEGCAHTFVTHRDAIAHGDRDELERKAARRPHSVLGPISESVEWHVARSDLVPTRCHADLGLVPVGVAHPHRPQHGSGRRLLRAFGDIGGSDLHRVRHRTAMLRGSAWVPWRRFTREFGGSPRIVLGVLVAPGATRTPTTRPPCSPSRIGGSRMSGRARPVTIEQ